MDKLEYAQVTYARHGLSIPMSKVQQKEISLENAIEVVNIHFESFAYKKTQFICNAVCSFPRFCRPAIFRALIRLKILNPNK